MNFRHFSSVLSLVILSILPVHWATAEDDSFLDVFLRITGISVTANQVREGNDFIKGDIWLAQVGETEASEPRKITRGGGYHTPLWIPGSQSILAMKGDKIVRLNAQGNEEKTPHTLTDNTALLGFDKNNPDRVLVIQGASASMLSLTNWQIAPLQKLSDRDRVDLFNNGSRDYGTAEVSIKNQSKPINGRPKQFNTIQIKRVNRNIAISCPSTCSQPALAEDGRQLLFIGH